MSAEAPRRRGRPAGSDGARSRAALVDAARRQFVANGYARTTTRSIAEAAGMHAANLRHHLGSKAEVFTAVYDDCLERIGAALLALIGTDGTHGAGDHVRRLGGLLADEPEVMMFLAAAPLERRRHPELQTPLGLIPQETEQLVRRTVQEWAGENRVREGVDPDALVDVLIATTYGMVLYATVIDPMVDRAAAFETVARLVDGDVWA